MRYHFVGCYDTLYYNRIITATQQYYYLKFYFITTESKYRPTLAIFFEWVNVPTSSGENVAKDVSYTINILNRIVFMFYIETCKIFKLFVSGFSHTSKMLKGRWIQCNYWRVASNKIILA